METEEDGKEPFTELNRILDCLKQRELGPALEWAAAHRPALEAQVNILLCSRKLISNNFE